MINEDDGNNQEPHVLSTYDRVKSFYTNLLYERIFVDTLLFEHETNLFEKNKSLIKFDAGISFSILACIQYSILLLSNQDYFKDENTLIIINANDKLNELVFYTLVPTIIMRIISQLSYNNCLEQDLTEEDIVTFKLLHQLIRAFFLYSYFVWTVQCMEIITEGCLAYRSDQKSGFIRWFFLPDYTLTVSLMLSIFYLPMLIVKCLKDEQIHNISEKKMIALLSLAQKYVTLDKDSKEAECSICLAIYEQESSVIMLPCDSKHIYHAKCIQSWFKIKNHCPLCREEISI